MDTDSSNSKGEKPVKKEKKEGKTIKKEKKEIRKVKKEKKNGSEFHLLGNRDHHQE